MKTAVAPRTGPGPAVLQALPILFIEAAVLTLHFVLPAGSLWREAALVLLAPPVFLAALNGTHTIAPTVAFAGLALANDVSPVDAGPFIAEALFLAIAAAVAWRLALGAETELQTNGRVQKETRQRATRLRDTYGHWPKVALTRMGAYVTGIEEQFLEEALSTRPGGTVLDVGAASGRLEHALTSSADRVIATDIDRDEIYAMAEDPKVAPAVVGELPALPLGSRTVDTVVAVEVPAASETDWFRAECARVLRDDGRVLLTVYNARSYKGIWMRLRNFLRRGNPARWNGIYYRTSVAGQLRRWRSAGFEICHQRGFYWTPLARDSQSEWVTRGALLERLFGLRFLIGISPWVLVELRRVERGTGT